MPHPSHPSRISARSVKPAAPPAPRVFVASGPDGLRPAARLTRTVQGAATEKPPVRDAVRPARRKSVKGRLLWIGDAVVPTGFATVTHSVLAHLHRGWDVTVSGINHDGRAHSHPYPIFPAQHGQGDMWGMNRFAALCAECAPDVVMINNDWWNVARFLDCAPPGLPVTAYMPVDGRNLDRTILPRLNRLAAAVWYARQGHEEAVQAGFRGARHIIPHGIDPSQWNPVEKSLARQLLELPVPPGAFLVGNVNRNQPRKRLDLTIQFFAEWVRSRRLGDAWLLLHCAREDAGWDLEALARHHGVLDRLIITGGESPGEGVARAKLQLIYSALDVQVSTTLGEGWGLTTMEGMACGVPQLVPDWAALGEWAGPALKVPCSLQLAHPGINTLGALPDKDAFLAQLDRLHGDAALRRRLSERGCAFTRQGEFQWERIAQQFDEVLTQALRPRTLPRRSRRAVQLA